MPSIQDRNVLITGGTGALGTAVVQAFVHAGARVTVSWVVEEELPSVGAGVPRC